MPTSPPIETSDVITEGAIELRQLAEAAEDHAAVAQAKESTRPLGVLSLRPKLRPETETLPSSVRPELSTPR